MSATRRGFLAGIGLAGTVGLEAAPSAPEMPKRTLGKTGIKVTVLGFGCMTTSDPTVIEQAADAGINWFDTARGYQNGNNERMVGAALKSRRDKLHITSKTPGKTKAEVLANLDTTLKELQTDHIDVWYLHSRSTPSSAPDELFDAQDEAVKAGKVRFKGVSFHSGHKEMIPFLIEKKRTDVLLMSYNFTMDPELDTLIDKANAAGMGIVAMKVMAGGFRQNKQGSPMFEKLSKTGTMAAALKWAVRRPAIHTSIPGIMDSDQLDENFKAVAAGYKKELDDKLLAAQLKYISPLYCRFCGTCNGKCAQGLPVSDIIRYVSYAEGYGEFALGRENYQTLPGELQQVKCGDCTQCSVNCPNGVRVAERVARAQEMFA
ncbi:aldo/keto reductase [uncultured Paludibaculum sp.]|uniref:aldo/keto reductase n=1 Tax=uncultured Paludibaculum sp. TaxID=1765020 RepID=UPI002AAC2BCE|nr:aldo/keto reductase [uncultured Paludibaculum sp.]